MRRLNRLSMTLVESQVHALRTTVDPQHFNM